MAEQTQFKLSLNGITLELSGDQAFVEEMYREIMRDIEEARARMARGERSQFTPRRAAKGSGASSAPSGEKDRPFEHIVWVHRCSELVHKIYMASPQDLGRVKPLRHLDPAHLATMYVEDRLLSRLMPQYDRGQTLWAELTQAGRARIAEASAAKPRPKKSSSSGSTQMLKGTSQT